MSTQPAPVKDAQALMDAFSSFTEISSSLEKSYRELQKKVRRLSRELEESNYYLSSVLESLPCGVMVLGEEVKTVNRAARELFQISDLSLPCTLEEFLSRIPYKVEAGMFRSRSAEPVEVAIQGPTASQTKLILRFSWSSMRRGDRVIVIQDVTGMRRLEEQMQKAERTAATAEMAVEVAHEIRNPLAALELFVSLLSDDDLARSDQQRYLSQMRIGIRSLNAVLTNMLCFARDPKSDHETLRLGAVAEEVANFTAPLLRERGVEMTLNCRDDRSIEANREMIRQVILNLILNALQALPQGGHVEIETGDHSEKATLAVRDDGVGIPPEHLETIFAGGFTTQSNGNGLGLVIVQRVIEGHGGRISASSREGEGTEFLIELPAKEKVDG